MPRIFISYKRVDKDKVFKIKDQIESALGEKCWIDLDGIESDAQFMNVIISAINECEIMLFMYSKSHSLIQNYDLDWTIRELNFAQKRNKRIVFINLDNAPLTDAFEFAYGTKQQVDSTNNEAINKLIVDLKKWLLPSIITPIRDNLNEKTCSWPSYFNSNMKIKRFAIAFCVSLILCFILLACLFLNFEDGTDSDNLSYTIQDPLQHVESYACQEAVGYDVVFTCNVPSAKLYVDGKECGRVSDTYFLKTGDHCIMVTADGYRDYLGKLTVNSQTKPHKITLREVPKPVVVETPASVVAENPAPAVKPTIGTANGHEWVDLGLPSGTKWATMNVGATSSSDYGSYFAWGETSPKSSYDWSNLKYCLDTTGDKFSKYVTDSKYGTVDGKKELDLSDDAAHVNWGSRWRMPSRAQQDELREKCKWTWTTQGGHNGYKVVGPNGNFIFLPAAGYRHENSFLALGSSGYYWSSSLCLDYQGNAYYLSLGSSDANKGSSSRGYGRSIRPVRGL